MPVWGGSRNDDPDHEHRSSARNVESADVEGHLGTESSLPRATDDDEDTSGHVRNSDDRDVEGHGGGGFTRSANAE